MADVEIGMGKVGRRGYSLAEVAILPSRRTRDPRDVDISWQLDAFRFALPFVAAPRDGIVGPDSAALIDSLGVLAVLDLEGLWTRYADPQPLLDEIAEIESDRVTRRLQEIYSTPVQPELVAARVAAIVARGAVACGAVTPSRAEELVPAAVEGGLDVLVIEATTISAEQVSRSTVALNLERFIRTLDLPVIVGGCSSHPTALHLMRTGAVGVLVGVGPGESPRSTRQVLGVAAPLATAIADAAGARSRHLEETGVYVHVIAQGPFANGGDVATAIACGADAVMLAGPLASASEAPGRGVWFASSAAEATLPRGGRLRVPVLGTLEEVLSGPAPDGSGRGNLGGALRQALAL
ncbi:MAG TPA: GuaB3 family IMP dehydrogenase-related protein, partial [Acidimicrobiales bacterium]|nr:GuaB3 family IMP dehydrogenase-related protein [Acidimicrobiales bacterium]